MDISIPLFSSDAEFDNSIFHDLLKAFPRNFEISTNNGKYKFNQEIIEALIPNIKYALSKDENLKVYHFDINDEQNVMQKIENLFKGELVEFLNSEEKTIQQITLFFTNGVFPQQMFSTNNNDSKFPKKIAIQLNPVIFMDILKKLPRRFKIKTNQNEYLCCTCGTAFSKTITSYLHSNPTSTEFYFDYNEENYELEPIINFFNFENPQITKNDVYSLLDISEQLGITVLINYLNQYIDDIEDAEEMTNEIQQIIDPYDDLFHQLFNINEIGIEKVANFILRSKWVSMKTEIQELASCIIQAAKISFYIVPHLANLVQIISSQSGPSSELAPFLIQHLLVKFMRFNLYEYNDNLCAFIYSMSRLNLVSTDAIIMKILSPISNKSEQLLWFLPEIFTKNILSTNHLVNLLEDFLSQEQILQIRNGDHVNEFLGEAVDKVRILRENRGQKDQLIESIRNDNIDTFQSIITCNSIDVHRKNIKLTPFDGVKGEITFIDYSAFCGSIKCFKYLYLEKVPISYDTFNYAIQGGNIEIIHILDQNKDSFMKSKKEKKYSYQNNNLDPMFNPIKTAILYYRNDIFDWMFDNSDSLNSDVLLYQIFGVAVSNGNAHVISKVIEKGITKCSSLSNILYTVCLNGLYKMLLFLSYMFSFDECLKDELNIENIVNASVRSENVKIFNLIFEEIKVKHSLVFNKALIEASKYSSIDIIRYILDNKLYELSDTSLVRVICGSIESGRDELIDYFIGQNNDFPLTTEIFTAACATRNIKIVKILIQKANKKGFSIDFTQPFLKAVSSHSEEIIKLFIELKVDINFKEVFNHFYEIFLTYPEVIPLLINGIKPEFKSKLIRMSFKTALSMNNIEILKFLITEKYEFEELLIKAAKVSNLRIIKTILEFNHSVEFINRVGRSGTALFAAVKSFKRENISKIMAIEDRKLDKNKKSFFNNSRLIEIRESRNEIVKYLLKQEGINPSISVDSVNTPLVEAVRLNNTVALDLILDFYGDSIKNQGNQIHEAFNVIFSKQSERINSPIPILEGFDISFNSAIEKNIFNKLLGIKILGNNHTKEDFLSYAILSKDPDFVENLLNNESINVGRRLAKGDTYLHMAIERNCPIQIQRLLLDHPDIDINSTNELKETPLIKAVKSKNKEMVGMILNHPKFVASLSLLDIAFLFSVESKDILMILIKVDSLDVNYNHILRKPRKTKSLIEKAKNITTPLIEAVKIGDIDIIQAIISHRSFDPIKSHIISCLFMAIKVKNLTLFKFFLELNGGNINLKNMNNQSLLYFAAKIGSNSEILKEILGNSKFDPVKSDIQNSFIKSADTESKKILVAYDETHKLNLLNFDKIYLLTKLDLWYEYSTHIKSDLKYQNSIEFLLRRMNLLPVIPSICTSVLSNGRSVYQRLYRCKTCHSTNLFCEICARVCHKGHEIIEVENNNSYNQVCCCNDKCKCKSIVHSVHDELYDSSKILKKEDLEQFDHSPYNSRSIYFDENENDYNENENEKEEEKEGGIQNLSCTLDLARFYLMSQPIYHCRKCKIDICQSCAIICHKNHALNFKGFLPNISCQCIGKTKCKCTARKDIVCSFAFCGYDSLDQPCFSCQTCNMRSQEFACIACLKKCHCGHNTEFTNLSTGYCDCGASGQCKAMNFPPFNYITSCTNRNKYQKMKQRLYHCKTCGITAVDSGICEACALLCHLGHNVVYIGIGEFACECLKMNDMCTALSCPEITCDGYCSRSNSKKNSLFPAFVCLSCDKDGKKMFCMSCALRCHKGHDVHFMKYSNFECQCHPCKCKRIKINFKTLKK